MRILKFVNPVSSDDVIISEDNSYDVNILCLCFLPEQGIEVFL